MSAQAAVDGDAVVLAELEVFHTRPAVPTRRISLGHLVLPSDPPPGLGGILLGAVVARHIRGVDPDLHSGIRRLILEVEHGQRIVQPRLRHRFQVDRHGLAVSRHRLLGRDERVELEFGTTGSELAQVLGAVYALERLDVSVRPAIAAVLLKGFVWRGPTGPALIAHLAGAQSERLSSMADPRAWALELLGFQLGDRPSRRDVSRHYRDRLRDVHPDHGGGAADAADSIADLTEARRILSDGERLAPGVGA